MKSSLKNKIRIANLKEKIAKIERKLEKITCEWINAHRNKDDFLFQAIQQERLILQKALKENQEELAKLNET